MSTYSAAQKAMENAILDAAHVASYLATDMAEPESWLSWVLTQLPVGTQAASLHPGAIPTIDTLGHLLAARAAVADGVIPQPDDPDELFNVPMDALSVAIHTETMYHMLRLALLARDSSPMLQAINELSSPDEFTFADFMED